MPSREPTPLAVAAYALPALPLALLTLPLYVIVPAFYAQAGLSIATIGAILLAVRLFDAVTDPLAGVLSDRTTLAFGRRRFWVALGTPLTALGAFMVFNPPESVTAGHLALWSLALTVGWTIALVPYNAWGAELSSSYHGRSRVAMVRETATFLGTLAALIGQFVINDNGLTLEILAVVIAVGLPITVVIMLAITPEPENRSVTRLDLRAGLGHLLENRPFLRLLAAFFINGLANGFPATLFLFFVSDALYLADKAGLFLLTYFVAGVLGMPAWLMVARLRSKHRAWSLAMLLACMAFAVAPLLPPRADIGFFIVCLVTGLAVGADLVLPVSMQADVVDADTAASGEQRTGLYLALWGLASKFALALAVGIAFPILAASGYDPGLDVRTEDGRFTLAVLYAWVPIALKLGVVALVWGFPIDAARQAALRATIEASRRR
jgi:Na+/melibiose symporter-like transporter